MKAELFLVGRSLQLIVLEVYVALVTKTRFVLFRVFRGSLFSRDKNRSTKYTKLTKRQTFTLEINPQTNSLRYGL